MSIYQRWLNNYDLGTARYTGLDDITDIAIPFFGHKFGRVWFEQNRHMMDPRIAEVISKELESSLEWTDAPDIASFRLRLLESSN